MRYDVAYQANYSGADGTAGIDATAGLDGSAGMDAPSLPIVDAATGRPGTHGPDGRGSDGGNGGDGFLRSRAGHNLVPVTFQNETISNQHRGFVVHHQDAEFWLFTHGLASGKSILKIVPLPKRLLTPSLPA